MLRQKLLLIHWCGGSSISTYRTPNANSARHKKAGRADVSRYSPAVQLTR